MEGAGDGYKDEGGAEQPPGRKDHPTCIQHTRGSGAAGGSALRLIPSGPQCYTLPRWTEGYASGPQETIPDTIFP